MSIDYDEQAIVDFKDGASYRTYVTLKVLTSPETAYKLVSGVTGQALIESANNFYNRPLKDAEVKGLYEHVSRLAACLGELEDALEDEIERRKANENQD